MRLMRISALVLGGLLVAGCAGEEPPPTPEAADAPPAPVERSPEEDEPFEPPPSIEMTGGAVAAMHQAALREADPAAAARMFEQGCDSGFTPSCLAFADRLESGEGVEPDAERARALVEEACEGGSTIACDRLGH